ncbi:uncharacterized protein PV06_00861 [Exophiala oligosperma]|uniref:Zn(2)-C6 fungal-type domain-containing protein n=1 Tax=Exophiala oligosperma TaxID=215243 RepID=A0A0D2E0C7_9EURO|nr:uncharacterized protein PV06_00861 [Exophiala oligosperma]KIW48255.1 hypothetical protein PV06_00861 [Exophiala oligosperma]
MTSIPDIVKGTRIKACTECRQQKLRCDASNDYSQPCSRCRKFGLECVVSRNFRRVKRRTKSELQAELDQLKRRVAVDSVRPPPAHSVQGSEVDLAQTSGVVPETMTSSQGLANGESTRLQRRTFSPTVTEHAEMPPPTPDQATSSTLSQSIQGMSVDAHDIDECFTLFFDKNLPYVPIFDTKVNPDDCYRASPFLFWAIVTTGARKSENPTLILTLAPKVMDLAKLAIFASERYLPTIQALILMCTWPIPIDTLQKDKVPMLAGAMLQIATNMGLHVYGTAQDFTRVASRHDRRQRDFRTRLWALCLITCQRVNNLRGLPPLLISDTYSYEGYRESPFIDISATIQFQRKLNRIQTEATLLIDLGRAVDQGLTRLASLSDECTSHSDRIWLLSAQLQLQACLLLAHSSAIQDMELSDLYGNACTMIEFVEELDKQEQFASFGPTLLLPALHLAALLILRIGKSHVSHMLELQRGRRCFFVVIDLNKKMSVRADDLAARGTIILAQLWTSKVPFKLPDGTVDPLWLRCRSRLGMSICFDCYWLWRQEFGGLPNPYDGVEDVLRNASGKLTSLSVLDPGMNMGIGWSPETPFTDCWWPQFDELVYDNTWQQNGEGMQDDMPR